MRGSPDDTREATHPDRKLPCMQAIDNEKLRHLITAIHAGGSKAFVRVGGHMDRLGIQYVL